MNLRLAIPVALVLIFILGLFGCSNSSPAGNYSPANTSHQQNAGTVTASDGLNTVPATFAGTTSMDVSPVTGYVGSQITVTGTGFSGTVTIKYDNSMVATTPADTIGTFTTSFNAPVSLHGDHTILATDGRVTLQKTFSISSTPPAVPQLLLPASGSTQNSTPTFSWASVSDPSGVTYDFQIAVDPSFSSPIVNEIGLTTTRYQLTPSQSLQGTSGSSPYYWRVKAVDKASNESAFTTPNTFAVGTLYSLIISVNGQGTTMPNAGTQTFQQGTTVGITAYPEGGWQFSDWSGSVSGSSPSVQVVMNGNKNVIANFTRQPETFGPTAFNIGTGNGNFSIPSISIGDRVQFSFEVAGSNVNAWVLDPNGNTVLVVNAGQKAMSGQGSFIAADAGVYQVHFDSTGFITPSVITVNGTIYFASP